MGNIEQFDRNKAVEGLGTKNPELGAKIDTIERNSVIKSALVGAYEALLGYFDKKKGVMLEGVHNLQAYFAVLTSTYFSDSAKSKLLDEHEKLVVKHEAV
jgi:hypothetical protein